MLRHDIANLIYCIINYVKLSVIVPKNNVVAWRGIINAA